MTQSSGNYNALCASVGHIVINWAASEQTIDMCVTIIFRFCGGKKLRPDLPRSLSTKTRFMRDAFRKLPTLKPVSDFGLQIVGQVDALATVRNEMVHGAIVGYMPSRKAWHFLKFDYGVDIHAIRDVFFSTDDFRDAGRKTQDLGEGLLVLANRLKRFAPWPK